MATRCARDFSPTCRPIRKKICDHFTGFPASGPILQPKRTYPFAKWRTLKVNLLGKKGRLMKRRSTFLYHSGRNIPCLFDKTNPDHKDQNKHADLLHDFSGPTNRHDKSQRVNRPLVRWPIWGIHSLTLIISCFKLCVWAVLSLSIFPSTESLYFNI